MFSVLFWYSFEVQHCATSTLTLDAQAGWLSQLHPPQRCTSITFVSSNARTISPSWWATHCEWTLSTAPLHPLLIPHKLPYRKTIQTSQHFPSRDVSSTPSPSSCTFLFFLIRSSYSAPRFYPFYYPCLGKRGVLCLEFAWIAGGEARGIIIYCLFIYLFIYSLFNDAFRACNLRWGKLWVITVK